MDFLDNGAFVNEVKNLIKFPKSESEVLKDLIIIMLLVFEDLPFI